MLLEMVQLDCIVRESYLQILKTCNTNEGLTQRGSSDLPHMSYKCILTVKWKL